MLSILCLWVSNTVTVFINIPFCTPYMSIILLYCMIYIPLYQFSVLYPCRWHSAIPDRSRGDWHGLWDPVWENEGLGARGPWADHPTCLQCPAQRDADQDFWANTPWVKKGNWLVISDPLPPSSQLKIAHLHCGKELHIKVSMCNPFPEKNNHLLWFSPLGSRNGKKLF